MDHQAAFSPNFPEGSFPPREIFLHDGVGLFRFTTSLMLPVDELTSFPVHICYDPEELVPGVLEGDGLEGKTIHTGEVGLLHQLSDSYIAVGLCLLRCGTFIGDKADLKPIPR